MADKKAKPPNLGQILAQYTQQPYNPFTPRPQVPRSHTAFQEFRNTVDRHYNGLNLGMLLGPLFSGGTPRMPIPEVYMNPDLGLSYSQPMGLSFGMKPGLLGLYYKQRF